MSPRRSSQAPRGVRPWRDRGGGRAGGGQQRLGGGHAGADAVAGVADQRHRGGDPGGVRVLRIQPGPTLFEKEPLLIWTLIASLFIGNFLLLVLNLPLAPLWAKLLRTPRPYLYAGILFFATLGALAVNVQALDLALLLVFGLLGLMMRRFGLPVLPLIIGVILGPRIERQLRQSLQLGGGDWTSLFTEPVAIVVYILIVALLPAPLICGWCTAPSPIWSTSAEERKKRSAQKRRKHDRRRILRRPTRHRGPGTRDHRGQAPGHQAAGDQRHPR